MERGSRVCTAYDERLAPLSGKRGMCYAAYDEASASELSKAQQRQVLPSDRCIAVDLVTEAAAIDFEFRMQTRWAC